MILWIDDVRRPTTDCQTTVWCKSVDSAIQFFDACRTKIDDIYIDHDSGSYNKDGGDFIKFLDWLEYEGVDMTKYNWHILTMNPVGRNNMIKILRKNGVNI